MGKKPRRNFDGNFKSKVVLEAFRERKTLNEICKEFDLHPNQISDWKKQIIGSLPGMFDSGTLTEQKKEIDEEVLTAPLYQHNLSRASG